MRELLRSVCDSDELLPAMSDRDFKRKVLNLVDSGKLTVPEAAKLSNRAVSTIYGWRRKLSNGDPEKGFDVKLVDTGRLTKHQVANINNRSPVTINHRRMELNTFPGMSSGNGVLPMAIVPTRYPAEQLSKEQSEEVERHLISSVDQLGEGGVQAEFSGFHYYLGGCVLLCDNHNSKEWLSGIVRNIKISSGLTLRAGSVEELQRYINVQGFFPGEMPPNDTFCRRLRVQNSNLPDMIKWSLAGTKVEETGFFAALRIPESCLRPLEDRNWKVSYGVRKVKLQCLRNRKASVDEKVMKAKAESDTKDEKKGKAPHEAQSPVKDDCSDLLAALMGDEGPAGPGASSKVRPESDTRGEGMK